MEGSSPEIQTPEIQAKDRLRAVQRQVILKKHFKEPLERDLLGALIPKDRPMQQTQTNANHLRQLAKHLGKDAHTVFFGLAATAKNPVELQNILVNTINLKNIDPSYWKFEDSEGHFLRRKLPKYIDVSEGAEIHADPTPADKDLYGLLLTRIRPDTNAMRNDPRYALESLFYTISAKNVPFEEKKRVLSDIYSAKTLSAPSGNEDYQKIYGSHSSFWSHVDGSWIYPKLAPKDHAEQPKKPNIVRGVVSDMKSRLNRPEATLQGFASSVAGQRQPDGHIYGLYSNAIVTLQDGKEYRVGNYPHFLGGTVSLEDGNKVPSDQIVSFRNPDSEIDISVWNTPAPKPRNG